MTWFEEFTGIEETSPEQVRAQLSVDGDSFVCPNGNRIVFGRLETPNLAELRDRVRALPAASGEMKVSEVLGDAQQLHADASNAGAMFQVASQFNLLEMVGPGVTPERGVGIYENDRTQGPACAIACGAGTIYRNYIVPVGASVGQSATRQIDCAADLGKLLGNADGHLWKMRNGYLLPTDSGLAEIEAILEDATESERDQYRESLRIGLQWDTAVTLPGVSHRVSQAYCSALPVAYGRQAASQWSNFAKLVLEAAYEATICAAIINAANTGHRKLFLTLLGGGAFGNNDNWVVNAIGRAILKHRRYDLDVAIVSYRSSKPLVADLIDWLG